VRFPAGCILVLLAALPLEVRTRWTTERARAWQAEKGWLVGANFTPSTAINQLEMWQAGTFDPATIDRELGLAESLGFDSVRVFLHDLVWKQDGEGFLDRMDRFLAIAERHHIGVLFVLFDGVWDPSPRPGPQRAPRPHVHNSGWVQSPGAAILSDPVRQDELEEYVRAVVSRFHADARVDGWDVFNEPDNRNEGSYGETELKDKPEKAAMLLRKAFAWARGAEPSQPLTAGLWMGPWPDEKSLSSIEKLSVDESDVVSFHSYAPLETIRNRVEELKRYERPILCTEYMARPEGSRFDPVLGFLKEQAVAAYDWGLVSGKTQTIYPWDSWKKHYTAEPEVWFHDIFRPNGRPFSPEEVAYIRRVTGR
jgi:Glycosyl hydrolase family 10